MVKPWASKALGGGVTIIFALGLLAWYWQSTAKRWVTLAVPAHEPFKAHMLAQRTPDQTLFPKRVFLFNLKQKVAGIEASHVYEMEIDCFHDHLSLEFGAAFSKANGEGEQLRLVGKRQLSRNVEAVMTGAIRSVCSTIIEDRSNRRVENLSPERFPIAEFLTCSNYREGGRYAHYLHAMRKKLIPREAGDAAWVYATKGKITVRPIELPISETLLGVCNQRGDIDCGTAIYIALKLDWSIDEAARQLKLMGSGFGRDYLEEVRDSESQTPERPYLVSNPMDPKSCFLICDSGAL